MEKRPTCHAMRLRQPARLTVQRGVTLVIALIALVVLTGGAIALTRSTNVSLRMAGNLAFKRDLVNQGERAVAAALADLTTGGALASEPTRQANAATRNYSATLLPSSAQGIPNVLLNDTAFGAAFTRADITDANGLTMRYVIDRQCSAGGSYDVGTCQAVTTKPPGQAGDNIDSDKPTGSVTRPVYRISVRITGPRGVQTYTQTTLAL
jgi:type IV pilus assembly protein PilX